MKAASSIQLSSPIERRTLHAELCDRMRALLTEGDMAPGERINEQAIAEMFGVSRTPVREALKVLATEGMITITPHRGATVADITEGELADTFQVIGALEALAGELAAKCITEPEIAKIAELHDQMVGHYKARDRTAYFEANQQIHALILAAARNETLSVQHRQLAGRVRRARYHTNLSEQRWRQAVAEHDEILATLRARKGPALARQLKAHLDHKLETLLEMRQTRR